MKDLVIYKQLDLRGIQVLDKAYYRLVNKMYKAGQIREKITDEGLVRMLSNSQET